MKEQSIRAVRYIALTFIKTDDLLPLDEIKCEMWAKKTEISDKKHKMIKNVHFFKLLVENSYSKTEINSKW